LTLPLFPSHLRRCLTIALVFAACIGTRQALAVSCAVVAARTPSDADEAFLHSDYDRAATLYQEQLQQKPDDSDLTVRLAQVFLRQQKVKEAEDVVQKALAQNPKSAALLTALGDVQYREGTPWLAGASAEAAMKVDPCYPQLRLLNAQLMRLSSLYASAAQEISTAHALAPHDPQIRRRWLDTLPLKDRITELEAYLSTGNGDDPETIQSLHFYLDYLKRQIIEPHKSCRLVSDTETATVPFAAMMRDGAHIRAFGLDVKFNNHNARLEIDTGASGLVISRSVAEHAGLKQFSQMNMGGIGSDGRKSGYTAFADDIKIGSLEFRDCAVAVIDQRNVVDSDGLIGMDVFSHFLITLDYPMRKLLLAPLPARPDDIAPLKPTLQTTTSTDDEDPPVTPNSETPSSGAKVVPRGPRNRYIAPEMKDWTRIYRIGHNLLIPTSLNNTQPRMFILDTGAFTTSITPEVAREVTKVYADDRISVHGISGKVDKVYSADNITFKFANVAQKIPDVVAFATPAVSKSLNMEVSGFIGFTALGQMTIGIDYRDGLMKFAYDANRGYKLPQ
jgi:predicted aspartyl protease/Tfp pilus assembly protein PilF